MARRRAIEPPAEERYRQWHRWFGLLLTDHLTDLPVHRRGRKGPVAAPVATARRGRRASPARPLPRPLPDGLNDFVAHNLITFKSFQEPLDDWALKELTGRLADSPQAGQPAQGGLFPEADFRFVRRRRYPRDLFSQRAEATFVQDGVYDLHRGTDVIRVVVAGDLPTGGAMRCCTSSARRRIG